MLKLLLNEEISPSVARILRRGGSEIPVAALVEWEDGNFVGKDTVDLLREAADQ